MYINQISVFVENRTGRLSEITQVLADETIDIRALSIADTSDFGILRIIVDKPDKCCAVLKEAGITTKMTRVLAAHLEDVPGSLHRTLMLLRDQGVDVEYAYAFISRSTDDAYVILRVEDIETAANALINAGIKLLDPADLYDV